ncbi:MAG TPA: roadblock/LC7 domain-containing protein [Candidatus Thermoplasmatota archaeon]|nr:roadblock/LC7 domain-containing protein [Candidatus Thermoplasmatota archaeon]
MSREAAQQVLESLTAAGALGAVLATRDGLPALRALKRPVSEDTFSAMAAALLGAAEAALAEWSEVRPAHATIETAELRLVVDGVDTDHILAAVVPAGADARLQTTLAGAAAQMARALRG